MQGNTHTIHVGNVSIGSSLPLVLISGPCVIESLEHTLLCAHFLKNLSQKLQIPLIFKASFDKANRSSLHSFRGIGREEGLEILAEVKSRYQLPVTSDIHSPEDALVASDVLDLLQIPAFLCRQTDLIVAAAQTGKPINVKKGQFLAPWDMAQIVEKIHSHGNKNILLTDRGTTFGYNNLVSDMRSLPIMKKTGFPACFDASHSVQLPGGHGSSSGGQREFIPPLTLAAVAAGADALFIESHPNPQAAKSDKDSVIDHRDLEPLLQKAIAIRNIII